MQTVRGMIENYFYMVQINGNVPIGNRIYYKRRSQPPILTRLVSFYVTATNDTDFAIKAAPFLDIEFKAWDSSNAVIVNGHKLYIYGDITQGPRIDAYREDTLLANTLTNETDKQTLYENLRCSAESSVPLSSRWYIKNGTNTGSLIDTKCRNIIPTELNSILYRNFGAISQFYRMAGNNAKADEYAKRATDLLEAITAVLWNEDDGIWYDYDLINDKQRKYFSVTNFIPFASFAYNRNDSEKIAEAVMKYISINNLDSYMGGIPTTFENSGEDFDYPNVFAQFQWLIIFGLQSLNVSSTNDLAKKWALRWLDTTLRSYQRDGVMYEIVRLYIEMFRKIILIVKLYFYSTMQQIQPILHQILKKAML